MNPTSARDRNGEGRNGGPSTGGWHRSGDQIIIDLGKAVGLAPARPADPINREVQYEDLPRVTVELKWRPDRMTRADLAASKGLGGGVYIATDANDNPLKVGMSDDFARRAGQYNSKRTRTYYANLEKKKKMSVTIPDSAGWYFYIATITSAEGDLPRLVRGYGSHVENAIARALLRAKQPMPAHESPVKVANVLGRVEIKTLLPPTLVKHLTSAYQAKKDARGKNLTSYSAASAASNMLLLTPGKKALTWESEPALLEQEIADRLVTAAGWRVGARE